MPASLRAAPGPPRVPSHAVVDARYGHHSFSCDYREGAESVALEPVPV